MKTARHQRFLSSLLLLLLSAAIALSAVACFDGQGSGVATTSQIPPVELENIGEGQTEFIFRTVFLSGESRDYRVRTDKINLAEALLELGLIEGEESIYGIYVKSVCGEVVDFNTHGKYWALYVNGEYSMVGASSVDIVSGFEYSFIPTA